MPASRNMPEVRTKCRLTGYRTASEGSCGPECPRRHVPIVDLPSPRRIATWCPSDQHRGHPVRCVTTVTAPAGEVAAVTGTGTGQPAISVGVRDVSARRSTVDPSLSGTGFLYTATTKAQR